MENQTINNNQKAINFFLKRFNTARQMREDVNAGYTSMWALACNATTWAEWDAVVPSHYDSEMYTAWQDTEGFNFMKPRLLKKISEEWSDQLDMYSESMASALAKLEELKK